MKFGLQSPLFEGDPGAAGGGVTMEQMTAAITAATTKTAQALETKFTTLLKPFEGLGAQLTTLTEGFTAVQEKLNAPVVDVKKGADGKDVVPPEVAAQLQNLTKAQTKLQEKLDAADKARDAAELKAKATEKESKLRAELNGFTFVNPEAAEDAFTLLNGQVDFDDSGALIAGGLPLKDFVKDYLPTKKAHLLAPTGKGGAGASNGRPASGAGGAFQMEQIKAGMSAEETQRAAGSIVQALKGGA